MPIVYIKFVAWDIVYSSVWQGKTVIKPPNLIYFFITFQKLKIFDYGLLMNGGIFNKLAISWLLLYEWLNVEYATEIFGHTSNSAAPELTGLKLENYYFFTFTFSRPEVRKLLLFYVFTFSRPEVRKLLLFYVFTFSRPEVRKLLLFYFYFFSTLKLEKYYFFTFLLFLDLKLENYYFFPFLLFLDLKLENYYFFTFSRPEVRKLFRIYVFTFSRPARPQ